MPFDLTVYGFCTLPNGSHVPYRLADGLPSDSLEASLAHPPTVAASSEALVTAPRSISASPSSSPKPQFAAPESGFVGGSSPTPSGRGAESGTPSIRFTSLARAARLAVTSEVGLPRGPSSPGSPCLSDSTQRGADPMARDEAASSLIAMASPEVTVLELSKELEEMAMAEALPSAASPRLRSVLSEHFSLALRCAPNAPVTLDAAATAMPAGAFGVITQAVQRACQAAWFVRAKGLSLLKSHKPVEVPPALPPPSEAAVAGPPPPGSAAPWVLGVVPVAPRGKRLALSPAMGLLPPRSSAVGAFEIEQLERRIAGAQLLAFVPPFMHHLAVGLRPADYEKLKGPRTEELFRVKFDSFSAGSAGGCRRALQRLVAWLQANGLQHLIMDRPPWLDVTGGLLSLWLGDEKAASRGGSQGGGSMALSLRSSITWGVAHMGLVGLDVTSNILKSAAAPSVATPKQATAISLRVLQHFRHLRATHGSAVVRYLAAANEFSVVAALRARDAQRCSLSSLEDVCTVRASSGEPVHLLGSLQGDLYRSKHPTKRSATPRSFMVPRRVGCDADDYASLLVDTREGLDGASWDYLYPRTSVPRLHGVGSATWLPGPASSAEVIRRMRGLLRLAPLSLSHEQASAFSGHSARHCLVCFATAVAEATPGRYSSDQLAMIGNWAEGMVTLYSSEVLPKKHLELLARILHDVDTVLANAASRGVVLPVVGGWADLAGLLVGSTAVASTAPNDGLLPHEDSSSGSDSDDD